MHPATPRVAPLTVGEGNAPRTHPMGGRLRGLADRARGIRQSSVHRSVTVAATREARKPGPVPHPARRHLPDGSHMNADSQASLAHRTGEARSRLPSPFSAGSGRTPPDECDGPLTGHRRPQGPVSRGGRCRIRTCVGIRRRIYSPLPLAARTTCQCRPRLVWGAATRKNTWRPTR